MNDGRVVSGMESGFKQDKEMEEDQGTLGSNGNVSVGGGAANTMAKESNIVNYGATNEGSDSRMRSTMYITGKSQKFALPNG